MRNFSLLIIFFIPITIFSQSTDFYDVVYLKQGNYVKGMVLSIENGKLEMVDTKGKSFNFSMSEIDRIEKPDFDRNDYLNINPDLKFNKQSAAKPFYMLTKMSINRSVDNEETYLGGTVSGGFNYKGFGFGMGIAYNGYTKTEEEAYLPVMFDIRYTFYYPSVKPYLYLNPGYSFKLKKREGFMLATGVGALMGINNFLSVTFELGYYWQKFNKEIGIFTQVGSNDFLVMNFGLQLF